MVDENGLTQVCVREQGTQKIAEIQKRQQNQTVPVAYIDFIQDFIAKKELKGEEVKINDALGKKAQFDTLKSEIESLVAKKDYKSILERMGITIETLEDGTWAISEYKAYIDEFALTDLGIKENDLLANVSIIRGKADFKDSNVTTLPLLKEIGEVDFAYADISNLKSLTKINGQPIKW